MNGSHSGQLLAGAIFRIQFVGVSCDVTMYLSRGDFLGNEIPGADEVSMPRRMPAVIICLAGAKFGRRPLASLLDKTSVLACELA